MIPFGRDVTQYTHRLAGYFDADPVAGEYQDVQIH
jgi:hypothetical protein